MHEAFLDGAFHLCRSGRRFDIDLYIDHVTLDGGYIEKKEEEPDDTAERCLMQNPYRYPCCRSHRILAWILECTT